MQCKQAEQTDSWLEKALKVGLLLQILYHRCSFQLHLCSLPLVQTGSHSMVCGNMAVHHAQHGLQGLVSFHNAHNVDRDS